PFVVADGSPVDLSVFDVPRSESVPFPPASLSFPPVVPEQPASRPPAITPPVLRRPLRVTVGVVRPAMYLGTPKRLIPVSIRLTGRRATDRFPTQREISSEWKTVFSACQKYFFSRETFKWIVALREDDELPGKRVEPASGVRHRR